MTSYFALFKSLSRDHLAMSSTASLAMVTNSTKANGATYVNRNPTLRNGMNCERAMQRKKKLKKNLNWLISTTGMNVTMLYFWLFSRLVGKDVGRVLPEHSNFRFFTLCQKLIIHLPPVR